MTSYNQKQKQEMIMKHYSSPNNKKQGNGKSIDIYSHRCVDELHLYCQWNNHVISDISFTGQGCAVFLASTDIVLDLVKGKTKKEVEQIVTAYKNMINQQGEYDNSILGEAQVFDNVKSHLNRLECAEMIVRGLEELLKNN